MVHSKKCSFARPDYNGFAFGRLDQNTKEKLHSLPILSEQVILLVYIDEIDEQLARKILGSTLKHEYELCRVSAMHTEIKKMIGSDN